MIIFLYMTEITLILKMEFLALIFIIIYIGAVCVLMLFHIKLIKTFMIKSETNLYENNLFVPFFFVFFFLPLIQLTNIINILIIIIFIKYSKNKKKNTKKNGTNKLFSYKFVSLFIINVLINLI